MSMAWVAVAAVVTTGVSTINAVQARKDQKKANAQALRNAALTAAESDRAINKANAKAPDSAAALAAAIRAGKAGNASTSLTGPGGVDPATLTLGKTTPLGG